MLASTTPLTLTHLSHHRQPQATCALPRFPSPLAPHSKTAARAPQHAACGSMAAHPAMPLKQRAPASSSPSSGSRPAAQEGSDEYEVELEKPVGLKFYRGSDGCTYIDAIAPRGNADNTKMLTPGDKVVATSAVFGTEMWPAAEYGRTMYTIRQRIGTVTLKMQKRYGERVDAAVSRDRVRAERNAGVIGDAVREIQIQNYMRKMELKRQRESDLSEALNLYKLGKYEEALEKFDSVLGSKPELNEEAVANYNIACCYSKLNEVEAGLSALEAAMEAGFEEYKTIRTDPDLENLRASPEFKPLIDKYDEPFINENAINALKNIFGIFEKK